MPIVSGNVGAVFNGGTVTTALNINPGADVAGVPDLGMVTAHPALNYDEVVAIGSNAGVIWELDSDGSVFHTMREDGSKFAVINAGVGAFRVYNNAGTTQIGFFDKATGAAAPQPTVTGSKGANAALASLCTALAALGLIVNNTT